MLDSAAATLALFAGVLAVGFVLVGWGVSPWTRMRTT